MSTPKEPTYFAYDFPGRQFVSTEKDYLGLFREADNRHSIICDASPAYFSSEKAIPAIKEFNPDAYIIVMLRNPIEMLRSYHSQLLYSLIEDQKDFESAWRLQESRLKGDNIPPSCREPRLLQYRKAGLFSKKVKRLYGCFPAEKVKIIMYDEFRSSPQAVYQDVLSFLGLEPDNRTEFPVVNAARRPRLLWVNAMLHRIPGWALRVMRSTAGSSFNRMLITIHQYIGALNSTATKKNVISSSFRLELEQTFREDVSILSGLLSKDMNKYWGL